MIKKILCLVIAIMLMLTCVGCGSATMEKETTSNSSMFVIIEGGVETYYQIVYHRDTKVMYAVSRGSYNQGTFTVMLDADCIPLLWEG